MKTVHLKFLLLWTLLGSFSSPAATRISTAGGGNWGSASTWSGGIVPTSTDSVIILAGSSIQVADNRTIQSITFSNNAATSASLSVNSGVTLTVTAGITNRNAAGFDTSVLLQGAGAITCASMTIGGTTTPSGNNTDRTATLASTISNLTVNGTLSIRALYNSFASAANRGVFELGSGTVTVNDSVAFVTVPLFGPVLTLASGNQEGTLVLTDAIPFTITGGGSSTFTPNGTNSTVVYSGGSQTVRSGSYTHLTLGGSGTKTTTGVTVNGTLRLQGTASVSVAPTYGTSAELEYNGSSSQTTGLELTPGVPSLKINNSSGVTLASSCTVSNTLTFLSGRLHTANHQITLSSIGSIVGAASARYVNGTFEKRFNTGTQSFTYPVGDATAYTPIAISGLSVSSSGGLRVKSTGNDHPQLGSSGITRDKNVERYWTLTQSGGAFGAYDATFNYVADDVDAAATPAKFSVKQWTGVWTERNLSGTPTGTVASIAAQTGFGGLRHWRTDLVVHERKLEAPDFRYDR